MSGRELWVFETMQGCGGPPGGLPPQHNTTQHAVRNALREQCTAPARRSLDPSLTAVWWEDEGRLKRDMGPHTSRMRRGTWNPNAAAGLSNATEKLKNSEASRMFFPDGTLSAVTYALLLGITCLTVLCDLTKGSSDFSGWEIVLGWSRFVGKK